MPRGFNNETEANESLLSAIDEYLCTPVDVRIEVIGNLTDPYLNLTAKITAAKQAAALQRTLHRIVG